eukprot:gnl/TRDRNA2_/TRDRNA2_81085_c0_seq1.p1 gnl/TRDRNA2_/TRDRNA2_81085_c0~~gnl/TRDRNA2_/TRDRNA2_81085_c0_seq1.p1  ORF type:complete len:557 (+),score=106.27 gnl/TRDRNA2_/TRDRNA2_81085_c0_seq1:44-1714(+)
MARQLQCCATAFVFSVLFVVCTVFVFRSNFQPLLRSRLAQQLQNFSSEWSGASIDDDVGSSGALPAVQTETSDNDRWEPARMIIRSPAAAPAAAGGQPGVPAEDPSPPSPAPVHAPAATGASMPVIAAKKELPAADTSKSRPTAAPVPTPTESSVAVKSGPVPEGWGLPLPTDADVKLIYLNSYWDPIIGIASGCNPRKLLKKGKNVKVCQQNTIFNFSIWEERGKGPREDPTLWKKLPGCSKRCIFTQNHAVFHQAHAAVWNVRWMQPQKALMNPAKKPKGQLWLMNFFFESPVYGGGRVAYGGAKTLAPGIDWSFHFASDSDFFQPVAKVIPTKPVPKDGSALSDRNYHAGRPKLIMWFVSNCVGPRLQFFKNLAKLLPADSANIFGGCGKKPPCKGRDEKDKCHRDLFGKYKFYAAFENSRCKGYVTEKFFRAYQAGLVPLVLGGVSRKDYEVVAPADSFIHVDDFNSMQELADHLLMLHKDEKAYNKYFRWKTPDWTPMTREAMLQPWCELCEELYKDPKDQRPKKKFGDILSFIYGKKRCKADAPDWTNAV